jgi:hypothetical protein
MLLGLEMIRATRTSLSPSAAGIAVYLDNWAIYDLAEGSVSRRNRFVSALKTGRADLLFSATNAAELSASKKNGIEKVRGFLDEIGPHWFPVELDTMKVCNRERASSVREGSACMSRELFVDYIARRLRDLQATRGGAIALDEIFRWTPSQLDELFGLGPMLDWVVPERDSITKSKRELDEALRRRILDGANKFRKDPAWLDRFLPPIQFDQSRPGMFAFVHLHRILVRHVKNGMRIKHNDGTDFSHAVVGSAFSHFAALDTRWQNRIAEIPRPHKLARIYSAQQLDAMVRDIEMLIVATTPGTTSIALN